MKYSWELVENFMKGNPDIVVKHQLDSFNDFMETSIPQIFKESNPIKIRKEQDSKTGEFKYNCNIYIGGKDGSKLYYGKPVVYNESKSSYMYPNDARLKNLSYSSTIHYDVDVEYIIDGKMHMITLDKIYLGRFPIMLRSNLCILSGLNSEVRYNLGECKDDFGGYFIIDGKEKAIVCQEKFGDNMLYIKDKVNDLYSHSAEIRSVSEDTSKPTRTLSIKIVSPTSQSQNNQIVVVIPNVRKPIPLFVVMRALGVISDKEIIETCLLDVDVYESYIDFFRSSVYDAGPIYTQEAAIKYIATFTKGKTIPYVMDILMNYLLPHIGELNFKNKAYFLGYMTLELLKVYFNDAKSTDRDSYSFKRVEVTGKLLHDLFKEYYSMQFNNIYKTIDKEYYYHVGTYQDNFTALIENNVTDIFKERIVEGGFKKAFKGNWGAQSHTKRMGVVQDLNRLSYYSFISHLRKINLSMDKSAKMVEPHMLHGTQWGFICPIETPDGGNIGFHKHLTISAHITKRESSYPLIPIVKKLNLKMLEECDIKFLSTTTKVMINGNWIGAIEDPVAFINQLKDFRRRSVISIYTSIAWNIQKQEILITTDEGRLMRPLLIVDNNFKYPEKSLKWEDLTIGSSDKEALIEYIDTQETETLVISMSKDEINKYTTHLEIHPSFTLGIMSNMIVFPENNQFPRNLFSCGQSKQAASMYHSNFYNRIDKTGIVLNSGQIPIVKSRYMKFFGDERHPYGENTIVAIMSYNLFNVEDAILINEASVKRGLFRTTYYNMYESREESSKVSSSVVDTTFKNIQENDVLGQKPGYNYSYLDEHGIITEGTVMDDKKIVIGKCISSISEPGILRDASVSTKKGQLGIVDKTIITEGDEGFRIAKVRIREERLPAIGDKFSSRCGQKGTIGFIVPEVDMPITEDGVRPDIIINPHAIPSRMTIGQLIEMILGKECLLSGYYGDCTAFETIGLKNEEIGERLLKHGFNSSGNEILYNGMTGEQLTANIFIGPTYYMRLKHMVKDKINYRARGPRTLLTRQTVSGRANDGGLRIGEMERDSIISHGMSSFLNNSMLERGDEYYIAVCNQSGTIAVYNESKNIFLSPMVDGPLKFTSTLDGKLNLENITKYGKSFSVVKVPYSYKLLMQELITMNIQMRIITEDNIEQLTTMKLPDNIPDYVERTEKDAVKIYNNMTLYEKIQTLEKVKNEKYSNKTDISENEGKEIINYLLTRMKPNIKEVSSPENIGVQEEQESPIDENKEDDSKTPESELQSSPIENKEDDFKTTDYDKDSPSFVRSSSWTDNYGVNAPTPPYLPPLTPNDPERISTPRVSPVYNPNTPEYGNVVFKSNLSSVSPSYSPPSSDDPYWDTLKKSDIEVNAPIRSEPTEGTPEMSEYHPSKYYPDYYSEQDSKEKSATPIVELSPQQQKNKEDSPGYVPQSPPGFMPEEWKQDTGYDPATPKWNQKDSEQNLETEKKGGGENIILKIKT